MGFLPKGTFSFSIRMYREFFRDEGIYIYKRDEGSPYSNIPIFPYCSKLEYTENFIMENRFDTPIPSPFLSRGLPLREKKLFNRRTTKQRRVEAERDATLYSIGEFIRRPPRRLYRREEAYRKSRCPGKNRCLAICTEHKKRTRRVIFIARHAQHLSTPL